MISGHRPRVPTLRAVDHVAYTVPDLQQAIRFFVDHFGGEVVFYDGPFVDEKSDGMSRRLDVHPRARSKIAMLRLGQYHNIELFEYESPDQRAIPPRNSDLGGHHLAFYVDDIDRAYEYVKEIPGVLMQEGPNGVDSAAPVAGQRWCYFRTPWGMQLEMTTCTTPGFYDGLPGAGMAAPAERWR